MRAVTSEKIMDGSNLTVANASRPSRGTILALIVALLFGLVTREVAYRWTGAIRYELNQKNAFYWGDRIVHGSATVASSDTPRGAASWGQFWKSYLAVYDEDAALPAPAANTLDYVPMRLLMAGAWVQYVNHAYGPQTEWQPEFARSYAAFSMVMEILGAAAMFALVARWPHFPLPVGRERASVRESGSDFARPSPQPSPGVPGEGVRPRRSHGWNRWHAAAAAAILFWLNPASIVDSHVWPHGQTWVLPFFLAAVLAMVERRAFLAGALLGLGVMFKGQMLLIAPMFILWPLFDRRPGAAVRVAIGIACGIGVIVWPWLMRGSFAWVHAGFGANGIYSDVLRKGTAQNFPALLEKIRGATLHEHILNFTILGHRVSVELKTWLVVMYAGLLTLISRGIAEQARRFDRYLLVSIATPWAVMFFFLGQMDERYLVWSATLTAAAAGVSLFERPRRALIPVACHALLTLAAVGTMIEFLLINRPDAMPFMLRVLVKLNPIFWLATAAAVVTLLAHSLGRSGREDPAVKESPVVITAHSAAAS